jgi:hypothetical protein
MINNLGFTSGGMEAGKTLAWPHVNAAAAGCKASMPTGRIRDLPVLLVATARCAFRVSEKEKANPSILAGLHEAYQM